MTAREAAEALRAYALGFPGAFEDFPWGERVVKVNKKVFVFMGMDAEDGLHLSVKLPRSAADALAHPYAKPTGYGLGKAGWVSLAFEGDVEPPVDLLKQWIDESYRAVAPKKLVKALG